MTPHVVRTTTWSLVLARTDKVKVAQEDVSVLLRVYSRKIVLWCTGKEVFWGVNQSHILVS